MGFYKKLQEQTAKEREYLFNLAIIRQSLAGKIKKESYIAFLTEAYHHVKHTVPLLMACGSRLHEHYEWLREAITVYIREETGHQEWILNDLAACGVDKEKVRNGKPLLATELMVAYAYDTISRRNPVSFFGMVQVLEGASIELATNVAGAIQKSLNLPDHAFSYLKSHGALDIEHIAFLESLLNRITGKIDQETILHSARTFYKLYADIFISLPSSETKKIAA